MSLPVITQRPGEPFHDAMQRAVEHAAETGRRIVLLEATPEATQRQTPGVDRGEEFRRMRELLQYAKKRRQLADKTLDDSLDVPASRRPKYEARSQRYNDEAAAAEFEAAEIRRMVFGA